jgi:hypothetical protein
MDLPNESWFISSLVRLSLPPIALEMSDSVGLFVDVFPKGIKQKFMNIFFLPFTGFHVTFFVLVLCLFTAGDGRAPPTTGRR